MDGHPREKLKKALAVLGKHGEKSAEVRKKKDLEVRVETVNYWIKCI